MQFHNTDPADLLVLWAKMKKGEENVRHPLLFHMLDTACVAQAMWRASLAPAVRRRLAGALGLTEDAAGVWIPLLTGLHDIGKASSAFQSKNSTVKAHLCKARLPFPIGVREPHGVLTAVLLSEKPPSVFDGCTYRTLVNSLAAALGGHHGRFRCPNGSMIGELGRVDGSATWDEARTSLLNAYMETLGVTPEPLSASCVDNAFLLLLAGFTSVADWIASAERFFPYITTDTTPADYIRLARTRAEEAIVSLGWRCPKVLAGFPEFMDIYQFPPRPLQETTAAIAKEMSGPGLVLIEAPMGEGKTESALHLAETWLRKLGQQGCYIAMPTMATANGMFPRVRKDYLSKTHPEDAARLRLLHGQAALFNEYRQLRVASVYDSDRPSDPEGEISADDWFAYRKRGLLSPYGVGTIDQALLSVLQARHGFVRLFGLAGKTVIIDEVHAYDVYTSEILKRLLQWLNEIGSSVVLLSATLPKAMRSQLVRTYGGDPGQTAACGYPRVTTVVEGKTQCTHIPTSSTAREVAFKWLDDDE